MSCSSTPLCFPGSSAGKESTYNAGTPSLIPGLTRCPGEEIPYPLQYSWASLVAQTVNNSPEVWETWVRSLGWEDLLEKGMGTHFSILTWRIPMDRGAQWTTVHGGPKESNITQHNLQLQGPFVPISLRPVLGIVAASVVGTVWSSCS